MKKVKWCVCLTLLAGLVFPAKVGTLPEVMKPGMIVVYEDELYVTEGSTFFIYSLRDLKLLKKFGKKGEGPGELIEIPFFPNKITILKDRIFVTGIGKAISFSKEGELLTEFRTNQSVFQLMPVGKNFVSKEQLIGEDRKTRCVAICLYNPEMKKIKELYRQPFVQQGSPPAVKLDMAMDFTSVAVVDDKIFIEESPKGFFIEVFDNNGKKLYEIKKTYEKQKLTSKNREELETMVREDPQVKQAAKQLGGWQEAKKFFNMIFPDFFPPIKGIEISGKKLYVRTYKVKNDKEEYIVMDLKGNVLKKVFISRFLEVSLLAQIAGGKLYSIAKDKLYYLVENEEEEEWELHVETLK